MCTPGFTVHRIQGYACALVYAGNVEPCMFFERGETARKKYENREGWEEGKYD